MSPLPVTHCATCNVGHSEGYQCRSMRRTTRSIRWYPVNGTPTVNIVAGGR